MMYAAFLECIKGALPAADGPQAHTLESGCVQVIYVTTSFDCRTDIQQSEHAQNQEWAYLCLCWFLPTLWSNACCLALYYERLLC